MSDQNNIKYEEFNKNMIIVQVDLEAMNGSVKRQDVEVDDARTAGSLHVISKADKNKFSSLRTALRRCLRKYGTEFLKGYAVSESLIEELSGKLKDLKTEFDNAKQDFVKNYHEKINKWALENPHLTEEIIKRAPDLAYIEKQLQFKIRMIKFTAQPEMFSKFGLDDGVEDDMKCLGSQLISDIAQEIKDNWANTGSANTRSLGFLYRISSKLKSLAFLDDRTNEISRFVESTIASLPKSGKLEGHDYLVFSGLMSFLGSEERLFNGDLSVDFTKDEKVEANSTGAFSSSIVSLEENDDMVYASDEDVVQPHWADEEMLISPVVTEDYEDAYAW